MLTRPQSRRMKSTFEKKLAPFFRCQHYNSMINVFFFSSEIRGCIAQRLVCTCIIDKKKKKNWWIVYTTLTCMIHNFFISNMYKTASLTLDPWMRTCFLGWSPQFDSKFSFLFHSLIVIWFFINKLQGTIFHLPVWKRILKSYTIFTRV